MTTERATALFQALYVRDWNIAVARAFYDLGHCESQVRDAILKARRANWDIIKLRRTHHEEE